MIGRCISFLVVILLFASSLTPAAMLVPGKAYGKMKARVVDANRARVARASVLVMGEEHKWRLTTNEEGECEISLPTGEYEFFVEAEGFRRFVSPQFKIKSGKTQLFNIEMHEAKPIVLTPAVSDPPF